MTTIYLLLLLALGAAPAPGPAAPAPRIDTLHGFMLTTVNGLPVRTEIWAACGNRLRSEMPVGDQRIITVQAGGEIRTWMPGDPKGTLQHATGLGALGLIEQCERLRAEGRFVQVAEPFGIPCDVYELELKQSRKVSQRATAWFARDTGLPVKWESSIRDHERVDTLLMTYEKLEAGVEVPDSLFALPADVAFGERE